MIDSATAASGTPLPQAAAGPARRTLSLIQRLWLLLVMIVVLATGAALATNLLGARAYLEQQLEAQGTETANALALMITQAQADQAAAETLINASFDLGHFSRIVWRDNQGRVLVQRENRDIAQSVPAWFRQLLPITPRSGEANLTRGWQQAGVLQVTSDAGYAYLSLWQSAWQTLFALFGVVAVAGLLGSLDIRRIRSQLDSVVGQARALGERRFVRLPVPAIPELARVTASMNQMVERLQAFLAQQAEELSALKRDQDRDPATGLVNRTLLERAHRAQAQADAQGSAGQLLLVRVADLAALNGRLGAPAVDRLLGRLADDLATLARPLKGALAVRLRGADFALYGPALDANAADALAAQLLEQLSAYPQMGLTDQADVAHVGATSFSSQDRLADMLARADLALSEAAAGHRQLARHEQHAVATSQQDWRTLIDAACTGDRLALQYYPVCQADGQMLWQEGMLYLPADGKTPRVNALQLVSQALQLRLTDRLDLAAVRLAAGKARQTRTAVNLTAASLAAPGFAEALAQAVSDVPAGRLNLEVNELMLGEHWEAFCALCRHMKQRQHNVAVEISGNDLGLVARLGEVGLDYLVLEPLLTRDIHRDSGRQAVVRGLLQMANLLGVRLIAKGISDTEDAKALAALGIWGMTGSAIGTAQP